MYQNGGWSDAHRTLCYADLQGRGQSYPISITRHYYDNNFSHADISEGLTGTRNSAENTDNCQIADIDGDGRAEIIVGTVIYTYSGGAIRRAGITSPAGINADFGPMYALFADFNGDGKSDRLYRSMYRANVVLSNGTLSSWGPSYAVNGLDGVSTEGLMCAADFNGDGRTDLLTINGSGTLTLRLSNGRSFNAKSTNLPRSTRPECADFNGDGLADVVAGNYYWINNQPLAVDALAEINTGLGQIYRPEYQPITRDTIYTKYSGAVRPQIDLQTSLTVVSHVDIGNSIQGWRRTRYQYEGLRADLHRYGTLGFAKVTSHDEATGISVANSYHQDYPLQGLKRREQKFFGSVTLSDTEYSYMTRGIGTQTPTALAAQVHLSGKRTRLNDLNGAFLGSSRETISNIDSFGNATSVKTEELDNAGAVTSEIVHTHTYANDPERWLIGQVTATTTITKNLRALPSTTAGN